MEVSYNLQSQRNLIGNRIFKLHEGKKLSRKEMAAQLRIQDYYFNELTTLRIERGKRLVADIEFKILCDYFHITPNDLLGYGDDDRLIQQCIVRVLMYYIVDSSTTTFQPDAFFTSGIQ